MLKKHGDEPIKAFCTKQVRQTTETTNELFDAVIKRGTPETGYNKFHVEYFENLETRLEETIIERVKDKLTNVEDFKVATMFYLPEEVRQQFAEFAAEVIERHETPMTAIDLKGMIEDKQVSPSDERLVEALCNSGECELKTLNLMSNQSWWKEPALGDPLLEFVKS